MKPHSERGRDDYYETSEKLPTDHVMVDVNDIIEDLWKIMQHGGGGLPYYIRTLEELRDSAD